MGHLTLVKLNVLNQPLKPCCSNPVTGYFRDGYCRTDDQDHGKHVVCAEVSEDFLQFTLEQGNDLMTPRPEFQFPGLKPGDRWCLCALRWLEAHRAGCAPRVDLSATDKTCLNFIDLEVLKGYSTNSKPV